MILPYHVYLSLVVRIYLLKCLYNSRSIGVSPMRERRRGILIVVLMSKNVNRSMSLHIGVDWCLFVVEK